MGFTRHGHCLEFAAYDIVAVSRGTAVEWVLVFLQRIQCYFIPFKKEGFVDAVVSLRYGSLL